MTVEQLLGMISTQRSHIETLLAIIKHIRNEMCLSNVSYKKEDYEEMKAINDELIYFIDKLMDEEK